MFKKLVIKKTAIASMKRLQVIINIKNQKTNAIVLKVTVPSSTFILMLQKTKWSFFHNKSIKIPTVFVKFLLNLNQGKSHM